MPRTLIAAGLCVWVLGCSTPEGGPPTQQVAPELEPTPATIVVAASLGPVARLPRAIHGGALAFGEDGRWWHWDGQEAAAFREGVPADEPLDAAALLAASPTVLPGHPLLMGSRMLTARGMRPLPEAIAHALDEHPMSHGGYERVASAWAPDGSRLAVARRYRSSACCGGERPPPSARERVEVYDVETGEHVELDGAPPLAISADRMVVGATVYQLDPLRPLHRASAEPSPPQAVAIDPTGTLVAVATADGNLHLVRAEDGVQLRAWDGPASPVALAFHPRVPLLAVADAEHLELWRVDQDPPTRLADAALPAAPHALVFDPTGTRLVATGFRPALLRLALDESPVDSRHGASSRALARPWAVLDP